MCSSIRAISHHSMSIDPKVDPRAASVVHIINRWRCYIGLFLLPATSSNTIYVSLLLLEWVFRLLYFNDPVSHSRPPHKLSLLNKASFVIARLYKHLLLEVVDRRLDLLLFRLCQVICWVKLPSSLNFILLSTHFYYNIFLYYYR